MNPNYTHIGMVLDRSGSMGGITTDTIGGVNHFIAAQQKAAIGPCTFTLVQFNHLIETIFASKPVAEVPPLTDASYKPSGSTALYDAIGKTIIATGDWLAHKPEVERPGKVIFVIVTDGYENASWKFNQAKVFDMIKHQREVYSWEFVFIGADQDAMATGGSIGVSTSNALNYTKNATGTHALYASLADNAVKMRSGEAQTMAWSDDDKKKQADAV